MPFNKKRSEAAPFGCQPFISPRPRNASYNCAGPSSTSFRPSRTRSESSACLLIVLCAESASPHGVRHSRRVPHGRGGDRTQVLALHPAAAAGGWQMARTMRFVPHRILRATCCFRDFTWKVPTCACSCGRRFWRHTSLCRHARWIARR